MSQKQISIIKQQINVKGGRSFITSLQIASAFNKEHKNVLRDIEALECSPEFSQLNFERAEYKDAQEKMRPMYNVYKNGFIMLVMGYQGRAAFRLKEAYIMAFEAMENELVSGMALTRGEATEAVLMLYTEVARAGYTDPAFISKIVRYRRMGLSCSEIGRIIDRPKSTVSSWIRKAIAAGIDMPKKVVGHLKQEREKDQQKAKQLCLFPNFGVK